MSKRGRPKTDTEQITVRLARPVLQAMDDVRRESPDLPSRPEVVRLALDYWLKSKGYLNDKS